MYNKKEWVSKEVITKEALNNIENGIADLDERLEELEDKEVEVDLSGYQEKTDNDLVTESKDIVGAINELFQSANNGKELIASAIGNELINSNSTFKAMSEAILALRSSSSGGGLDIISATELPATGKENQICVITDNPVDNYVVTSNLNDNANEDSITLYNVSDSTSMTPIVISSNGVTSYNYITRVCQGSTNLASYVYYTGQWTPLTPASYYLLKNGTIVTGPMLDKFGTFKSGYIAGTGLKIPIDSSTYYVNIMACDKSVDFSSLNFSKIKVTAYTANAQLLPYLYVVASSRAGQLVNSSIHNISTYLYEQTSLHATHGATKHTYELDITGWDTHTGYLGIGGTWSGTATGNLYITDIEFE